MSSKFALKAQISVVALSTALAIVGGASKATAVTTLFYSGDPSGISTLGNRASGAHTDATVLDPFAVPTGQTWSITDLFTNNNLNFPAPVTQANWQIQRNVVSGTGGTVVASGTDAPATVTTNAAGHSVVDVSGLNVTLGSGNYWLSVVPVSPQPGKGDSYINTTVGTNAVVPSPVIAPAYWNVAASGISYLPTTTFVAQPPYYSAGILGNNAGTPVPFEFSPPLGLVILGTWGAIYKFKQSKQKSGL
jgi:hypothetical protein